MALKGSNLYFQRLENFWKHLRSSKGNKNFLLVFSNTMSTSVMKRPWNEPGLIFCDHLSVKGKKTLWQKEKVPISNISLAVFGENPRYCYSLGIVCVMQKTWTFCNTSVMTEGMYLKLGVCVHKEQSILSRETIQNTYFYQNYAPLST